MPELVFFRRGEEVLRVGLERQRLVLGRGEDCDVVIPDPHVSRQQVALLLDGTRCIEGARTELFRVPRYPGLRL
jgi:predicted component of type VI protein secretion system